MLLKTAAAAAESAITVRRVLPIINYDCPCAGKHGSTKSMDNING
jgi:hypothetical protein